MIKKSWWNSNWALEWWRKVVGDRRAGLSILETTDLLWFSPHNHLRGLQTMVRKSPASSNSPEENVEEGLRRRARLMQMDYSSRRSHRAPLRSVENRKQRLQFTQADQRWTEDCKNIGKMLSCLKSLDFCCYTWIVASEFETMWIHSGGGGGFMAHSLLGYCCRPCPSFYDHSAPIFWRLLLCCNVTEPRSCQTGFLNVTMSSLCLNGLHNYQTQANTEPLGPSTRKAYLTKCPVSVCVTFSHENFHKRLGLTSTYIMRRCKTSSRFIFIFRIIGVL